MKKTLRLTVLVLCVALLAALAGCTETPPATTTVPPTTESPADTVYAPARAALDNAENITLDVIIATYTYVNDEEYTERSTHTLTYQGLGTESFAADMDGKLDYGFHLATPEDSGIEYRETYTGGTLYVQSHDTYAFSASMEAETAAARYTPVVLLDGSLYGTVTAQETENGTKLLFSDPSAAEEWALPAEAEMTDATGTALVSAEGAITEMSYTVEYTYGPTRGKLEVQSKPRTEAAQVAAPENPDAYPAIQEPDAIYLTFRAACMLAQADSITVSSMESTFSQAAGYMRNQSTTIDLYGQSNGTQAKILNNVSAVDYSTMDTETLKQEEKYVGGRYTVTVNDGLPSTQSGIDWVTIREYCFDAILTHILMPDFWSDVTITDMGSVYLLEYTLNENFGNTMQNAVSEMLWNDPSFLLNLASKYETGEVKGYLSVDKYTGISVAGGYNYMGTHTVEGTDYPMTIQFDQSVEAPSKGAFQEITGNKPMEEAPENQATPLFYHVTGESGQEMWLFGTIHVGDEATAYLPDEIRAAFEASDALALECNTEAFEAQAEQDEKVQAEVSKAYYYTDGTTLQSLMEEEEYELALKFAKATGTYNLNALMAKPYLWSNGIEQFYLRQGQSLHGDQGVEARLMDWADELNKPIREIESSMFQINMIAGYSQDLQLLLLRDAMSGTAQEYWEELEEMYALWCAGDEAALRELLCDEVDTSEMTAEELAEYEANKHLLEEYNKAMSYDRNDGMLKVAKEYLESGDTVFYAVGLAHLLNDVNGLVDALQEAGYTVEAVAYK